MTWHPGTEAPPRQGRYAITQDGRTWRAAGWTPDGWFDGYQRVRDVRGWCEVPAVDLDDDVSDWPTRGNPDGQHRARQP